MAEGYLPGLQLKYPQMSSLQQKHFDIFFWLCHLYFVPKIFSSVNQKRNRHLHLYTETGSLEFTNTWGILLKTLSLI